jgi:hypothetical protein
METRMATRSGHAVTRAARCRHPRPDPPAGARENNLKDVSVEIPKRRLTVFTGAFAVTVGVARLDLTSFEPVCLVILRRRDRGNGPPST